MGFFSPVTSCSGRRRAHQPATADFSHTQLKLTWRMAVFVLCILLHDLFGSSSMDNTKPASLPTKAGWARPDRTKLEFCLCQSFEWVMMATVYSPDVGACPGRRSPSCLIGEAQGRAIEGLVTSMFLLEYFCALPDCQLWALTAPWATDIGATSRRLR